MGICISVPQQPSIRQYKVQIVLCSILCLDRVWDGVITSNQCKKTSIGAAFRSSAVLALSFLLKVEAWVEQYKGTSTRLRVRTSGSLALCLPLDW